MESEEPDLEVEPALGVMFVHGMGNHTRGSALRQFGEPICRWLAGWLTGTNSSAPQPVQLVKTSYQVPRADEPGAPAHAIVDIATGDDPRPIRWVLAEGWWADEISQPPFGKVASWGLGVAPWMIVRHFRQHMRGLLLLPSLLVVILFQFVILGLTIVGVIPQLREPIARLQLAITGSLGDVMAMVSSPLQFSAMTTRLAGDLAWLKAAVGSAPVALVAHSQGTGVAHGTLRSSETRVDAFVTFGAALEKLRIAWDVQRNPRHLALGSTLTTAGVVLIALAGITWAAKGAIDDTDFDSAARWARGLLAGGTVLALAVMGLWFHLRRADAVVYTAVTALLLLSGVSLLAGGQLATDHSRAEPFLAAFRHLPWDWSVSSRWHAIALWLIAAGMVLLAVRVALAIAMPERNLHGGPSAHAAWAPGQVWARRFRFALDPTSPFGNIIAAGCFILALLAIAVGSGQLATNDAADAPVVDAIVLLICAGAAFSFAAVPIPVPGIREPDSTDFQLGNRPGLHWTNYWAPGDLVPDGDLPNPPAEPEYVHNFRVFNQNSLLLDHTVYQDNIEGFLTRVAWTLASLTGWNLVTGAEVEIVGRAQKRRRVRVELLTYARWLSLAGMVLTWWILGKDGLASLGAPLESAVGYVTGIVPGVDADTVKRWLAAWLLGGGVVAAITIFWFRVVLERSWIYWDDVEAAYLYSRESRDDGIGFERGFSSLVYSLASIAGVAAAIWSPNLLRLADRHLGLLDAPVSITDGDQGAWDYVSTAPWNRSGIADLGVWDWPWALIGTVTVVVSLVYWGLILLELTLAARRGAAGVLPPPPDAQ